MVDPRASHTVGLLVLGAAVLLSWQRQYTPASRALNQTRQRLISLSQQVERTEQLLASAGGQDAWRLKQQQTLQQLKQRFPPSAHIPALLDALLEHVAKAGLELTNVNQGNLEPAKDAQGQVLLVDNARVLRFPVTLAVEGKFRAVVACLEQLVTEAFPSLVTIEQVRLVLKDPDAARLSATVQLVLHVVGS